MIRRTKKTEESSRPMTTQRQAGMQQQQMIEKQNIVLCAASIVMGAAGAINFQNGCVIARTGAGVYTVTLDPSGPNPALALSAAIPIASKITAAAVACDVQLTQTSTSVWTITTSATLGGAAADVVGSLTFVLLAIGAPGSSGV
jgi:hypothetical protein